jgi:hypothetical protein
MKTTIKGNVNLSEESDGSIKVDFKKYCLLIGVPLIISWVLVVPLCFVLIGFVLIPIPAILTIIFFLIQTKGSFRIIPKEGILLKEDQIAFVDISCVKLNAFHGVCSISVTVKGEEIPIANLLKTSVADELYSLINSQL